MSVRLGIVMDPIARINFKKDSSLAMLLAAQARGWSLFYMEQQDLYQKAGVARGRMRPLKVFNDASRWFELEAESDLALARRRFGGVLRDPLRQDAQFAGMADVLLVMVRLGVEVGKVGEQQHDRDDEDDEQPRDHRAAAHAREKIACVDFLHIWPPPGPTTITISMSRHGPADRPNR